MRPGALIGAALAVACADPGAVVPRVDSAAITSDSDTPFGLARIDVVVTLHAGATAEGDVRVVEAALADQGDAIVLALAFSDAFDGFINPDQDLTAAMLNVGTSNADIEPWCRVTADLTVTVGLVGDDGTQSDPFPVTVVCTGG